MTFHSGPTKNVDCILFAFLAQHGKFWRRAVTCAGWLRLFSELILRHSVCQRTAGGKINQWRNYLPLTEMFYQPLSDSRYLSNEPP